MMLGPTLRFRMIFLFCVVIGGFLAGTYCVVDAIFTKDVGTSFDDNLRDIASLIAAQVYAQSDDSPIAGLALEHQFIERVDERGTVIDHSSRLNGLRLDLGSLSGVRTPELRSIHTGVGDVRLAIQPVAAAGRYEWIVVAEPITHVDELKANLREKAFGLWTISLLLTTLIAAWYVARSLAPIVNLNKAAAALTERITRTSSENIEVRLPVQNPNDELGQLAITFNMLFCRLDAVVCQLRQFVSDAAHELRTPLSVLRGETQFLLSQSRSVEEYQQTLKTIDSELMVMVQIIEGLFTLSMADAGQLKLMQENLQLEEVLEEACGLAAPLARRKGIVIETTAWPEIQFRGDPGLLRQVFLILLENAIKYSESGTRILVGFSMSNGHPEIFVKDEGLGISPDHLPNIFRRFYRAAPQIEEEPRSGGLGLAIAEAIMHAHGGTVTCVSELSKGSKFTLHFPEDRVQRSLASDGSAQFSESFDSENTAISQYTNR